MATSGRAGSCEKLDNDPESGASNTNSTEIVRRKRESEQVNRVRPYKKTVLMLSLVENYTTFWKKKKIFNYSWQKL